MNRLSNLRGQIIGEVERAAAAGKCAVNLCAKYDMTIFEPEEIGAAIDEMVSEVSGK